MGFAVFFSTSRCGTQWLTHSLASVYADLAVVTHEPLKGAYHAKKFYRDFGDIDRLPNDPDIEAHISYHALSEDPGACTYIWLRPG